MSKQRKRLNEMRGQGKGVIEGYPSATPARVRDIMRECKINTKGVGSSRHDWSENKVGLSRMSNGMSKTFTTRYKKEGESQYRDSPMFFW